jgi:hypothetical protein
MMLGLHSEMGNSTINKNNIFYTHSFPPGLVLHASPLASLKAFFAFCAFSCATFAALSATCFSFRDKENHRVRKVMRIHSIAKTPSSPILVALSLGWKRRMKI